MRARAYVDGFNLYYGAMRGHANRRWLDLWRFCKRLSPASATLDEVHYFTTRVSARPNDPDAPTRQDTFLRAIAALPGVHVHEGAFKSTLKRRRLVDPQPTGKGKRGRPKGPRVPLADLGWPSHAWTYNTEEKGSDVNLATKLVVDCLEDRADVALIVSDDTDLARPVSVARSKGLRVIIVSPRGYWLRELAPDRADVRKIHPGVIEKCQLPDPIMLPDGSRITKPADW